MKETTVKQDVPANDSSPSETAGAQVTELRPGGSGGIQMDTGRSIRMGWLVLLLGFGGFLLWSLWAPLDEGANFSGTVTLMGNRKTVQHPYGGVVEKVMVREGQAVKAGDLLVKLDKTKSAADLNAVRAQWITANATAARLKAERSGEDLITYPRWFKANPADRRVMDAVLTQDALFQARRAAFSSETSAMQETEAGLVRSIAAVETSSEQKQAQLRTIQTQLDGMREMAKEGYLAQNRVLDAERSLAAIRVALADDQNQLSRLTAQLGEVRMRMAQRKAEAVRDVQNQLVDVQRQVEELTNRLSVVQFDNRMAEVRSPVEGFVTALQVFTEGGVVTPGMKLMEIVPASDSMEIEGQLPVHLVDKVVPGLPVVITFPALNVRKTPTLFGRIRTVSADRITDARTGIPFYLVKVDIPPESYARLDGQQVVPGMPADGFVKLGERTLMEYITKPLTDRLRTALTER